MEAVRHRHYILLSIASFSTLLLVDGAAACSRIFPTFRVKNDFIVSVSDRGKPVKGVEIQISPEIPEPQFHFGNPQLSLTDEKGESRIHSLPPGLYFIGTSRAGIEGEDGGDLEVFPNSASTQATVNLHWPGRPIFKVQNIAGVLASGQGFSQIKGVVVLSTDSLSLRQVGATVTNEDGHFEFGGSIHRGLYILHISQEGSEKKGLQLMQGDIFVEVDESLENRELPKFGLVMTSCGLNAFREDGSITTF